MIVYKFGGASVADASNIKNVAEIIKNSEEKDIAVVISAMGKTTNALEDLLKISRSEKDFSERFNLLVDNHKEIIKELFGFAQEIPALNKLFDELNENLANLREEVYDYAYDQVVSFGELISTTIVYKYLEHLGLSAHFIDARQMIITDDTFREGIVDWEDTLSAVKAQLEKKSDEQIFITQGFIGSTKDGKTTTLGREGSDFTAAIVSFCIDADYMAIWKDVPGILTADPRLFDNVAKIDRLSYREAIEMTYYGAKVIHPKTIKPIQNKNIPLWVKSFVNPNGIGTLISGEIELTYPPMIVIEPDQALIHISTKDFSFVGEDHLSKLFQTFNKHRVRVNMMRNTAISFSVCTNNIEDRIQNLKKDIQGDFNMVVDHGLELITIRHYTEDLVEKLKKGKIQLFEERLQKTIQIVVKDVPNMIRKA
ncbi:aspartate kinase [Portibacter lacus]|uniref:Aspartokinase n=1 Tax=Portibacter lacus TaxID=1099794 RepID=A0AA37WF12_9BACT|nr:aspartate kinase [Portibacter lacus]GLR18358.1 aspartokinase [Portibacter lacus]